MWNKCRALIQRAQESPDPGYLLALLLLLLRSDEQGRVNAKAAPRFLRGLGRDLLTYRKLGLALHSNLLPKCFRSFVEAMPKECEIEFEVCQLRHVEEQLSVVAGFLESSPKDSAGRIKLIIVQDGINKLAAAIERSQLT